MLQKYLRKSRVVFTRLYEYVNLMLCVFLGQNPKTFGFHASVEKPRNSPGEKRRKIYLNKLYRKMQ